MTRPPNPQAVRCPKCGQTVAIQTTHGYELRHRGRACTMPTIHTLTCEKCKTTFKPGDRPGKG